MKGKTKHWPPLDLSLATHTNMLQESTTTPTKPLQNLTQMIIGTEETRNNSYVPQHLFTTTEANRNGKSKQPTTTNTGYNPKSNGQTRKNQTRFTKDNDRLG
jgi:hypothetical protein